jgi:Aminopeptidase N
MAAGADEVWGMIIFSESYLLYNKKIGNLRQLQIVASTICHEIAHQVSTAGLGL